MTDEREISINAEYLRLAQLFASKDDTRYYLKGVHVEPGSAGEGIIIVATDGHRMAVFFDRAGYVPGDMLIEFDKGLISALKSERSEYGRRVTIRGGRLTVCGSDIDNDFLDEKYIKPGNIEIDGTFPQWRRVLPSSVEPAVLAFDPSQLKSFEAVCKSFGVKSLKIEPSGGTGPIGIKIERVDTFYGVLMPMRKGSVNGPNGKPDWISDV